ncbi:MAG: alpha/beta hydrolase [Chthoniobacter sp.]|nr:alpha/beta hydrolase [Chthoniobacter sp.]
MERVTLGGLPQTIRIRGDDRLRNPVLLFVHGGPGLPEMPVAHHNAALERWFTVVQWDQRGVGKSFVSPVPDLTAERVTNDTLELSRMLRQRFGGRKIYLAGFSWGSLVAARAAAREPELFAAFIGISQLVNIPQAETALYRESLAEARRQGDDLAVRELKRAGPPPWTGPGAEVTKQWSRKLFPGPPNKVTATRFALLALTSPAYNLRDLARVPEGARQSYHLLERDIYAADLFREVPQLDVPAWFLMGRHDTLVSSTVLARYFHALRAPRGKHLVWFEHADHVLHLEEPEKYRAVMKEIRDATDR